MKKVPALLSGVVLLIVASFQACTPSGQLGKASSSNPRASTSASANDGGSPFDGKAVARFQHQDSKYCSEKSDYETPVRHEVVRDASGYHVSVQDCKAVPGLVTKKIVELGDRDEAIQFHGQVATKVDESSYGHVRFSCRPKGVKNHPVVIYENANGLTMRYTGPELSNLIAVTPVHETGMNPTGKNTYHSRYTAAYWEGKKRGLFRVWLNYDTPGDRYATWKLDLTSGQEIYGEGHCQVNPYQFPW